MEDTYFGTIDQADLEMFGFEMDFEPVTRTRSNTWPAPQPEHYPDPNALTGKTSIIGSNEYLQTDKIDLVREISTEKVIEGSSRKKKPLRQKNPWGDLSYAELITQAINSAPNRRLTLSQIYDWMVQNVPFFKAKNESKGSSGWKNSVRHNLSLHNRFVRIPNESPGKSAWWTINPDEKAEKTTRRRSASMGAGKLEKKRALAKKQADSLRKKLLKNENLNASNDCIDTGFQSSVATHIHDCFRPRASSCASSFGKFSSIPQIPEEPSWTSIEYHEPVTQSLVQQVNHAFMNQEHLTEELDFCLLHPVGACNCNTFLNDNHENKSNSSWKNSTSQGKNDSWMIHSDVGTKKTTRKRSASMGAGKLERKRTLAKNQADSIRKKLSKNENVIASNDCINTDVQSFISNAHLQDCFRPRASSCASSIGKISSISQIPEEPNWTSTDFCAPVVQSDMQPVNEEFNNQNCFPTNDQIFFSTQNLTEVTDFCLLHPVGACDCDKSVNINNKFSNSSARGNFLILNDSHIIDLLPNICTNSTDMPESTLLSHNEGTPVSYNNYSFVDQVNQTTEIRVLPRNNSMLDDINEIIKKDQSAEIEKVNASISTALFISNNNNNNNNLFNFL